MTDLRLAAEKGIALCRAGKLEDGYRLLKFVASGSDVPKDLPGLYYSYLGYCLALFEGHYNDGIVLCQKAIDREFYQAENHHNLARTFLLLDARRKATEAIRRGLRVDPHNARLHELRRSLGTRRWPMIRFLGRDHWLNRLLGRIRYDWKNPRKPNDDVEEAAEREQ